MTTIGVVGMLVKSKTLTSKIEQDSTASYAGNSSYDLNYLAFNVTDINHEDDLPIPSRPAQKNRILEDVFVPINQATKPFDETKDEQASFNKVDLPIEESNEDSITQDEPVTGETIIEGTEIHRYEPETYSVCAQPSWYQNSVWHFT